MKHYTIFFLLSVCLFSKAFGQQNITLSVENRPVAEVLHEIEQQSGFTFSYNPALLKGFSPVTLKAENKPLQSVLEAIFGKTPIQYIVRAKYVILKERPKNVTVSGYLYDAESHETLIAANVFDALSQRGAVSNNFGFFSLSVPPGAVKLRGSYVGYASVTQDLLIEKDTVVRFFLQPSSLLAEVVVEGKQLANVESVETGKITLDAAAIQSIPSFMGEKDVIKALQQLPGVAAGTDGVAGMYVRGGNADENLYLVDGNPMYHVNHLGGLFSAFNPEAVKTMSFYKGSFPARYGGRLSSVVDVRMNDGDMKKFGGSVSIGLISSRINVQGPIVKDKTSYSVSFRRTYLDLLARPILYFVQKSEQKNNPESERVDAGYYFYDFNAKVNHKFSEKSRLYLSIYSGKDRIFTDFDITSSYSSFYAENQMKYSVKDVKKTKLDMDWGTRMASLNWAYAINSKLFSNATLVYSRYASDIGAAFDEKKSQIETNTRTNAQTITTNSSYTKLMYASGIEDIGYRLDFDYSPVNNHLVRFGTSLLHHIFRPEESRTLLTLENDVEKRNDTINFANERVKVKELSLYAEDEIDFGKRLRVNAGIHFSGFFVQQKSYLSVQPRISARYLISDNLSVKASYGKMNQYIHLLQSSYVSLPNDLWVPITKNIKPMWSHQESVGVFGKFKGVDVSMEGYYKSSHHQIEYKEGVKFLMNNLSWEERVAQGFGKSYGIELMARKGFGSTTGWLGYTLSWAERRFPDGEINQGRPFPSKYDNRHTINAVATHAFNKKFDVSASWVYATGNWTTLPTERFVNHDGNTEFYYQQRNNFKMPSYHRLDLSFNYYRHKKNGRMGIWNISVYNVYSQKNSFIVLPMEETVAEKSENGEWSGVGSRPMYKSLCIFPIIPSFSYTYKF